MNLIQLSTLLLVPVLSAQAPAQVGTPTAAIDSFEIVPEETLRETYDKDSDDASQARVKGFLDTYHALRTAGNVDWMVSRARARGEVKLEKGAAALSVSLNVTHNGVLKERTGIELRKVYLSYTKGNLDLRVGRQIVIWGMADTLRLTDYVSPVDYTELLAQDYDDMCMPIDGLRVKHTLGATTAEAACNPATNFAVIPTDLCNPWAMRLPNTSPPYSIDLEGEKPEKRLKDMEHGGCISVSLSGVDFSVSVLHTWNRLPAPRMGKITDGKSLHIDGRYHRMTMSGTDCSLLIGRSVIRVEVAKYTNEAQNAAMGCGAECRNVLSVPIGIDWYPGNGWNASLQYCHKYTSDNLERLPIYRHAGMATARLAKELLQNILKLSTSIYVDVTNGGIFSRLSVSYVLSNQIELTVGYDYFHADKGILKMYGKNSEVWIKMKYSS